MKDERPMTDELELDETPNHEDLSPEELLEQSQINAQALFMATATALAGDAGAVSRWRQTLHDAYIRGWDADQDWEAGDILFALSTNYLSFGGRLVEWDYEAEQPSVVLENLPNTELAGILGVDPASMDQLFELGTDLARTLGGVLNWSRASYGAVTLSMAVP